MEVGYTLKQLRKQRLGIRNITHRFLGNHVKRVLAKRYSNYSPEKLKTNSDKANLKA